MDLETLRLFFFWSMVVNSAVYASTAIAVTFMRGFVCGVHRRLFDMDEAETLRSTQSYLSNFKLFITVFNFTPWVALLIID